jgi:quercetin dioxygenase-like cupin family protein
MLARSLSRVLLAMVLTLAVAAHARAADSVSATVLLRSGTTNTGDALAYPTTGTPEVTTMIVEIAPGASTSLHRHPVPSVAYMLQGQLEVHAEGGVVNRYKAGDAFLETVNRTHQGTNIGATPVRILVTYIGIKDEPVSAEAK